MRLSKFKKFNKENLVSRALAREEGISEKLELIDVNEIFPNPNQPRKTFDDESIKELAKSIEKEGLLQPIVIEKVEEGKYQLIAGERRLRAVKVNRQGYIKAIVKEQNSENMVSALVENIHRENLKPIEEAVSLQKIMSVKKCSKKELSKIVSKSYDHVVSLLSLTELPRKIKSELISQDSKISIQTLQALSRIKDEKKIDELYKRIKEEGLNKKDSLELISASKENQHTKKKTAKKEQKRKASKKVDLKKIQQKIKDREKLYLEELEKIDIDSPRAIELKAKLDETNYFIMLLNS